MNGLEVIVAGKILHIPGDDCSTLRGKQTGDGKANSLRCTGHQDDLSVETCHCSISSTHQYLDLARSAYAVLEFKCSARASTATLKSACVLALISSTVTPSASSIRVMPAPPFLSMEKTPRSVITKST